MAQACAVTQHLAFVVVHGDPSGLVNEARQISAIKHGQALAWIEHKRNICRLELFGMLNHGIATIGRNDGKFDV